MTQPKRKQEPEPEPEEFEDIDESEDEELEDESDMGSEESQDLTIRVSADEIEIVLPRDGNEKSRLEALAKIVDGLQ